MTTRDFSLTIDGAIATVTLDRGEEQNRLTGEALADLGALAAQLRHDAAVNVVVIRGAGAEVFSCGILNPALRAALGKGEVLRLVFLANEVFDAIAALPQIVIAGLNGELRAGAVELALACDIRVAAAHARLSMPEARWGGFPGAGAPVRLPPIVGYGRALELIATGRTVEAEEMLRIGLVERIFATPEFDRGLQELARTIAQSGPLATRGAKRIARTRLEPGLRAARELSDALRRELEFSRDVDEGIAAHRDGRAPNFTGR